MSTKADRAVLVDAWKGKIAVCIASGPSLTLEEIERVQRWREETGNIVIVVNTTFQKVPWADALYAMDKKWWMFHYEEINKRFSGIRVSRVEMIHRYKITTLYDFNGYNNSGAGAVAVAARGGVRRIIMLGYSLRYASNGAAHHHPDHPKGLGNARSIAKWPEGFAELRRHLDKKGIEYINCTQDSLLDWPWAHLECALQLG